MTQVAKSNRWERFVSLNWYDAFISFLFRFVAKTSELLLATGVIVSAADFLQHGRLMKGNIGLENTWAWTQALAIEASTGPVLVFALQAFRASDRVKGWLYALLAGLLFFVGGSMLLFQLMSSVSGLDEVNINPYVLYGLFLLRMVGSLGMVALSCTKHIRFSGKDDETGETQSETTASNLEAILASLDERYAERMQTTLETITQTITQTVIQQITVTPLPQAETPLQLLETVGTPAIPPGRDDPLPGYLTSLVKDLQASSQERPQAVLARSEHAETPGEPIETETEEPDLPAQVTAWLAENPRLSTREIAAKVNRPHSTVYRQVKQVKQQAETVKQS